MGFYHKSRWTAQAGLQRMVWNWGNIQWMEILCVGMVQFDKMATVTRLVTSFPCCIVPHPSIPLHFMFHINVCPILEFFCLLPCFCRPSQWSRLKAVCTCELIRALVMGFSPSVSGPCRTTSATPRSLLSPAKSFHVHVYWECTRAFLSSIRDRKSVV